jgi:hypothetical protein
VCVCVGGLDCPDFLFSLVGICLLRSLHIYLGRYSTDVSLCGLGIFSPIFPPFTATSIV